MPLPEEGKAWPPAEWAPAFDQFNLNDALYTGDVDRLAGLAGGNGTSRGDDPASHYNNGPSTGGSWYSRIVKSFQFWKTNDKAGAASGGENRTRVHGPLATNIATLSATTLMSEPPQTRLIRNGDTVKGPAQDRADEILNSDAMFMRLQQGAEWTSGLSGVALAARWGREVSDRPWVDVVACDAAIPEYVLGHLFAINLWTTYTEKDPMGVRTAVLYHVERHEPGKVIHALYRGSDDSIGKRIPLDTHEATAAIPNIPGSRMGDDEFTVVLPTGIDTLTASYWRNLPTRQFRKDSTLSRIGRADTEGLEPLLDQYDMVWSSWMRDIKLARARLIIPEMYLDVQRTGGGASFDDDQEIIQALAYTETRDGETIQAHQFQIRHEEHGASIIALTKEILQGAGYSMSSYNGESSSGQKTATEVNDDTRTTEATRDSKALYYKEAAIPLSRALLELDRVHHGGPGILKTDAIDIEFSELSQIDPEKEARIVSGWRAAQAASTETIVRFLHPEFDGEQVSKEVERIYLETGMTAEETDPGTEERVPPGQDSDEDEDEIEPAAEVAA